MSSLKRNHTYRNGKRILGSWRVVATLPTGKIRITLKGITDKRKAIAFKHKADDIEDKARLFPAEKDWIVELHYALGQQHKLPDYNTLVPKISEGFKELINERIMYGLINKKSTKDCYRFAMEFLVDTLGDIHISQISPMHKPKIEVALREQEWSDNTINIRVRNTMQFLRWCLEQKYIDRLPFDIKQIKVEKKTKAWIKPDEFGLITSVMEEVYKSYATVCYHTGLRLREVNTDPDDKAYNGLYHTIERVDNLWRLSVRGKQGSKDDIILPDEIKPAYDIMVANRRNPNNVAKAFRKACRTVGYGYSFHDTRHSFCSNQSLQTQDAYLLKLKMRHSNLNTTQTYLNDERLAWVKQVENEKYNA